LTFPLIAAMLVESGAQLVAPFLVFYFPGRLIDVRHAIYP
jgi:hypothetical protein